MQINKVTERNQVNEENTSTAVEREFKNSWKLWRCQVISGKLWNSCLQPLNMCIKGKVSFESVLNLLKKDFEDSESKIDYLFFFKSGIKPMWEDPNNKGGGRWKIVMDTSEKLQTKWFDLLKLLVEEAFGDLVNGASITKRNNEKKISIWLSKDTDKIKTVMLGDQLKIKLSISKFKTLVYEQFY